MTTLKFEMEIKAEGEVGCDGRECPDDCPIHPGYNITDQEEDQ